MQTRVSYTPPWLRARADTAGEKSATKTGAKAGSRKKKEPVFHLRFGDILERSAFEAEIEGVHRAGEVPRFLLLEAAVAGVRKLLPEGEDRDHLIELLESDERSEDPAEDAQRKQAHEILSKHWPTYKALIEQEARRNALLPTLAFLTFVDGWDNVTDRQGKPLPFARDENGEMQRELAGALDPLIVRSVGVQAYNLQYGRGEAKN